MACTISACAAARADPEALAARLFQWEPCSEWEMFYGAAAVYADVLGESGLEVHRRLADEVWKGASSVGPGW